MIRGRSAEALRDRRWDSVATIRVIPMPPGRTAPIGDAAGRRAATALIRTAIPGAEVEYAGYPAAGADEAFTGMHELIAERGGLGGAEVILAAAGGYAVLAHSHRHGDGPTMRVALAPVLAHLTGAAAGPAPGALRPSRAPLVAVIRAGVRELLRHPAGALRAGGAVIAEERRRAATPDRPVPARAGYRVTHWRWAGESAPPPRAIELAARWRRALQEGLPEATLDPQDAWLIVGLRPGNALLHGLAGNFTARIRMPEPGDPDRCVPATRHLLRSGFPVIRTAVSAAVQLVRQLLPAGGGAGPAPAIRAAGPAPSRGLATSWTHNRIDPGEVPEYVGSAIPPGVVSINAYERDRRCTLVVSMFADERTTGAIDAATRAMMRTAGYEEVRQ